MKMILMLCMLPMLLVREKRYCHGVMVEVVKWMVKMNNVRNSKRRKGGGVVMCRQSVKKQQHVVDTAEELHKDNLKLSEV